VGEHRLVEDRVEGLEIDELGHARAPARVAGLEHGDRPGQGQQRVRLKQQRSALGAAKRVDGRADHRLALVLGQRVDERDLLGDRRGQSTLSAMRGGLLARSSSTDAHD
jgi:hypothetical protein